MKTIHRKVRLGLALSSVLGLACGGQTGESAARLGPTSAAGGTAVITLAKSGTGAGVVRTKDGATECGAVCSVSVPVGSEVVFEASGTLSDFAGWSGPCEGSGDCRFVAGGDLVVRARFERSPWTRIVVTPRPVATVIDAEGNTFVTFNVDEKAGVDFVDGSAPLAGPYDIVVAKLDPKGKRIWAVRVGGEGQEHARSMAVEPDGSVVVGGLYQGKADLGEGVWHELGFKSFLLKLKPDGSHDWARSIDFAEDGILGVAAGPDGIVAVGEGYGQAVFKGGSISAGGAFAIKYGNDNSEQWFLRVAGQTGAKATAVARRKGGGHMILGHLPTENGVFLEEAYDGKGNLDVFLLALDADGKEAWSEFAKGSGYDFGMDLDVDAASGDVVFTVGHQTSPPKFGTCLLPEESMGRGVTLARYSETGTCLWLRPMWGADAQGRVHVIADAAHERVFAAGLIELKVDFGKGFVETTTGGDVFAASYAWGDGVYVGGRLFGGPGFDAPRDLGVDPLGAPVLIGEFKGMIEFGDGSLRLTSDGYSEGGFVTRLGTLPP